MCKTFMVFNLTAAAVPRSYDRVLSGSFREVLEGIFGTNFVQVCLLCSFLNRYLAYLSKWRLVMLMFKSRSVK
jgi:hypothetical protein